MSYLLINQSIIAQNNATITTDELKTLYSNGEYKKALSYTEYFINKKNTTALIILGDCCWKESNKNEQEANQIYYQSQMTQSMAISQGLYFDNSFGIMLYQQAQQQILQLRLQAIDMYSKASQLGNNAGNQRIAALNSILGNNTGAANTSSYGNSSNPQYQTKQTCGYCNGTGRVDGTVATYGYAGTKWCDFCKRDVPTSHCCQCKTCPSCGGTGSR